jgi:diguanylate cyclase (GGDEF)-like protein
MKLLLVDSSLASRSLTATHLRELGYPVAEAGNGTEALLAYLREVPDVVLLAVDLPDIGGYEVAREIRRQDQDGCWTPVVFFGDIDSDDALTGAIEAGGDDYLVRPLSPAVLRAKLMALRRVIGLRGRLADMERRLQDMNRTVVRLSTLDPLTEIPNRHSFETSFDREWRLGLRTGRPLSLILADIDFFKRFNDRYGHRSGDTCLRTIAGTLTGSMRSGADMVARIGGETFAVLLPETPGTRALEVAEALLEAIRGLAIPHAASDAARRVTLSLGVSACIPGPGLSPGELMDAADRALLNAKRGGRNRCTFQPASHRMAS